MQQYLQDWTGQDFGALEEAVLVAQHRLHKTGLFTDDALADLIDKQSDDYLTLAAMGTDASKFEWMAGQRGDVSGKDIFGR